MDQSKVFVLGDSAVNGVLPYTTLIQPGRQLSAPVRVSNPTDQVAYMCFSSGTTGLSKGVMTT
jgi:acyl-CoA synthetase (AMP-forming)/AMP-acid ligase II